MNKKHLGSTLDSFMKEEDIHKKQQNNINIINIIILILLITIGSIWAIRERWSERNDHSIMEDNKKRSSNRIWSEKDSVERLQNKFVNYNKDHFEKAK